MAIDYLVPPTIECLLPALTGSKGLYDGHTGAPAGGRAELLPQRGRGPYGPEAGEPYAPARR